MVVLIACDSYKGSLSTWQVIEAASKAADRVPGVTVIGIPIADGGEGTAQTVCEASNGEWVVQTVEDPLGRPCEAGYAIVGDTAIIDVAQASGLTRLLPEERDPMRTSTYGTGQLIRDALDRAFIRHIVLGVGGTATNDGGAGLLQAVGVRLRDARGTDIERGCRGLERLDKIQIDEVHPRLSTVDCIIASDVQNPLCGPSGASYVYGPQKGATPKTLPRMDQALSHYASIIERETGRDVSRCPGSGAGGGTVAGLLGFTNARVRSGIDTILDLVKFDEQLERADIVVTGEGMTDAQTEAGKAPVGVARRAKQRGKSVICVSGALGDGHQKLYAYGIDAFFRIAPRPTSLQEAMTSAEGWLVDAYEDLFRLLMLPSRT